MRMDHQTLVERSGAGAGGDGGHWFGIVAGEDNSGYEDAR